ncbi:hypothetical protein EYF80_027935 [Liparis tanakae]|uniref:Uncharacterized protein n=1 Tax=Liparis tanakae TaxID=230148 RepID=A0A4Z2H7A8_9TELE|nr:hypothetical protein EYF80_027935 [Liparis tanakae]
MGRSILKPSSASSPPPSWMQSRVKTVAAAACSSALPAGEKTQSLMVRRRSVRKSYSNWEEKASRNDSRPASRVLVLRGGHREETMVCVHISHEVHSLALLPWLRMSDVSSSSLAPDSPFTPFLVPMRSLKPLQLSVTRKRVC